MSHPDANQGLGSPNWDEIHTFMTQLQSLPDTSQAPNDGGYRPYVDNDQRRWLAQYKGAFQYFNGANEPLWTT